jgi:hypothetical protein
MRGIIVVTALTISAAPAAADTALHLPAPTGHQPVGATTLYLKDTSRPDPWVPSVNHRELIVSLVYPATSANGPKKQYMTPTSSSAVLPIPAGTFGAGAPGRDRTRRRRGFHAAP